MLEDVTKRLATFDYMVIESDTWILGFIILKVENNIKSDCNVDVVPEGLHQIAVDMVVGEFLLIKKNYGQLKNFNLDTAIKHIQEGDTSITYANEGSKTPEQRLDTLIQYLINNGKGRIAAFRCIRW